MGFSRFNDFGYGVDSFIWEVINVGFSGCYDVVGVVKDGVGDVGGFSVGWVGSVDY